MIEKFIENFEALFDEKPSSPITAETEFREIPGWDSLVALSFIVMVADNYGKAIDGNSIKFATTILDLFNLINE